MRRHLTRGILRIIAFLLVVLQAMTISVAAKDNVLSIYRNHPEDGIAFNVTNMFPGDCEANVYTIRVSYNGDIKVYFKANVRSGYEKLAEVLMCRVVLEGNSTPLYDGLMQKMPDLEHSLSAVNKTEDLKYEISVYLDTSVGNEYQNKQLVADFKWWAYTSDEGHPGGGGGGAILKPSTPPDDGDEPIVTPPDDGDKPIVTPPDDGDKPIVTPPDDGDKPIVTPPDDGDEPIVTPPDDGDKPVVTPPDDGDKPIVAPPDGGEDKPGGDTQRPTGELIDPPRTGDLASPILWIILICISLFIILLFIALKKKKRETTQEKNPVMKKLTICIVIIVILGICLCITTFALIYSISVDENIFKTGTVDINLNDGNPIIKQGEFLFEPGMRVTKDFFIENESSDAVYYKIYFDNVSGGLEKVLNVKIIDKETGDCLYDGKAEGLKRENCQSAELLLNEKRTLTAEFHYPEISGNETQNLRMSFDMCAVATQKKNNPDRKFD